MNPRIPDAYQAALPVTSPIMMGFLALGLSCGLFTVVCGLPGWYAPLMSVVIFGGSLEFVTATMLVGTFAPLEAVVMAVMVQSRHLFYGIAMLGKYRTGGLRKFYLIYALTDESFSVNRSVEPPEGIDRIWFMIAVSSLNQVCWVIGTAIGALIGPVIPFDISSVGFVMTALFTVILLEQVLRDRNLLPAVIGLVSASACLAVFGPGAFLIPTLLVMLFLLVLFRKYIGKGAV